LIATLLSHSPEDQWLAARITARDTPASASPLWRGERYRHQKIRVAYLSADFHAHATAYLMAGVFEAHDRTRFETIAVSFGPDDFSETRSRLTSAFDHFLDVRTETDAAVAARLKAVEVDIAIDLKGFTNGARPGILASRCAPTQAQYLGYPGTMGAPFVDYIVADRFVIPDAHRAFYTERVVTLPDSYQCNDAKRRIAEKTQPFASRSAGNGFRVLLLQQPRQDPPEMFDIWMRLLGAIDKACFGCSRTEPTPHAISDGRPQIGASIHRDLYLHVRPSCGSPGAASSGRPFLDTLPTARQRRRAMDGTSVLTVEAGRLPGASV
jgi:predicted O-linked N-acetylglucosamine transferase (SPINDLY family)